MGVALSYSGNNEEANSAIFCKPDRLEAEVMPYLLKEIKTMDQEAAYVLEQANLCTDSEIQSLTRGDLHELFPGNDKFTLRRKIYDKIHKEAPIHGLIRELKGFISQESLGDKAVMTGYLTTLKELKVQVDTVQEFLDAHIKLLESMDTSQPGTTCKS